MLKHEIYIRLQTFQKKFKLFKICTSMLTIVVFFLLGPVSVLKAQELKHIETLYSTKNNNIDIQSL